jgi:PAS domain S-box-containing protein
MRLKTKLVLGISALVVALVTALSYAYLSQLLRQRLSETYDTGDFLAHQIYLGARQALEVDLSDTRFDPNDPAAVHAAIAESLQTDAGLASLLQSIVGYAPTVYDAAITDSDGVVLLHTDADSLGKTMRPRPDFAALVQGGFWRQLDVVYGAPKVYEVRLPLKRGDAPFGEVRVGLSTVFLKNELRPQLKRTATFAGVSILVSLALALLLSSFALRPLEDIGERLDLVTLGQLDLAPESARERTDEVGVVTTKIARLGRQMRNVQEVFSALKENLDQIMANLQDGLLLFTQDTRVVLVSASAERFVGRPGGEMLGRRAEEIFTAGTRLGQVVGKAFQSRQPLEQREIETEEGRLVQVSLDFIEERGQPIGALLTMRDAESVRKIEDEIELSRRLAAIGRLTSGVAHEVKNPINAVLVHLEVLREKLQAMDPESRRHMDVIAGEIQRLDRVVQTLVDFTRPVELRLSDLDLRRTVEEVALLASPDASRQGVSIQRELPPEPLAVKADTDLLKQALLNIVLNGVQAMPQGGTLTIRGRREGGSAVLEVQDQGSGIPADVQEKVFNLYFTTKPGGSGIGLAMTYRVMQLHNGAVEFESQDGRGATFRLRLPAAEAHKEKAGGAAQQVVADS